jgi:hypothetical protein
VLFLLRLLLWAGASVPDREETDADVRASHQ